MSKSHLRIYSFATTPLCRTVAILMPCNVCNKPTQRDPYNKFLFGVCCETCQYALENRYKKWCVENSDKSKEMYINMVKKGLNIDNTEFGI